MFSAAIGQLRNSLHSYISHKQLEVTGPLQKEMQLLRQNLEVAVKDKAELDVQLKELHKTKDSLRNTIRELEQENDDLKQEQEVIQRELSKLKEKHQKNNKQLQTSFERIHLEDLMNERRQAGKKLPELSFTDRRLKEPPQRIGGIEFETCPIRSRQRLARHQQQAPEGIRLRTP